MNKTAPEVDNFEYQKLLGERVRRFRRELQLTQMELARLVGVTNGQISTIERGLSAPSIGTLHRISHAMGIPMIHFFDEPGQREVVVVRKVERTRLTSPNSPDSRSLRPVAHANVSRRSQSAALSASAP